MGSIDHRAGRVIAGIAIAAAAVSQLTGCIEKAVRSPEYSDGTVTFRFFTGAARTVQVAGDWNDWGAGDAEQGEVLVGLMERGEGGVWSRTIELESGRYRYYFIINESRRALDPANPRTTEDPRGGKANLLVVP